MHSAVPVRPRPLDISPEAGVRGRGWSKSGSVKGDGLHEGGWPAGDVEISWLRISQMGSLGLGLGPIVQWR
jgi:hypothetical protein